MVFLGFTNLYRMLPSRIFYACTWNAVAHEMILLFFYSMAPPGSLTHDRNDQILPLSLKASILAIRAVNDKFYL